MGAGPVTVIGMLSVRGLTRAYGEQTVVDEVSFEVRPGRMTGFVGGNGAGKTTTMRMILGVLAPTAGEVLWAGEPVTTEQRRRFGYMPEERGLYPRLGLLPQLVYLARLHGLTAADAEERARDLLGHFGLEERLEDNLDTLSLGNQQRVQIAAALIHRPIALILDEPFSGLDPLAVDSMVDLLSREAADLPVLFSSHQLELVERLCDDLVILDHGRVVAAGSTAHLRERGPDRYRVVVGGDGDPGWLDRVPGVSIADRDDGAAIVEVEGIDDDRVLTELVAAGPVREVSRYVEPLARVFREVVR